MTHHPGRPGQCLRRRGTRQLGSRRHSCAGPQYIAEIRHHPTPRRQPPDNQADIATLKERIAALEAELRAEQQRSGDYRVDFERERNRADREGERADRERERADHLIELQDHLIVELGALRTLLEEASRPAVERPRRWRPFRRAG